MISKKGAAKPGQNAAVLILIIGITIIAYSIVTEQIQIEQKANQTDGANSAISKQYFLLKENIGHLGGPKKDKEVYQLPSVTLYTQLKSQVFQSVPYVDVSSNFFGENIASYNFTVDDLNTLKSMIVTFNGDKYEEGSILVISLNGVDIYHDKISSNNIITLNKFSLKQGINTVKVKAESSFFGNSFILKNLQVLGDIYDVTKNKGSIEFSVFEEDLKDFKSASLSFYVDCLETEVGLLNIYVNNYKSYSAVPDCGIVNKKIDVLNALRDGNNLIRFENEFGSYVLDQVEVSAPYVEPKEPIYYFSIDSDQLTKNRFYLNLKFVDRAQKDAILYVNKKVLVLNTNRLNITYNITSYVQEGFNYVKVIPNEPIDIAEMNVQMKERKVID